MPDVDEFCRLLLEEAKRFLEKAGEADDEGGRVAYVHAALNLGFCALEAHINAIASELTIRPELDAPELAVLVEREFRLNDGAYEITGRLRMYRLEDRMQFIYRRFAGQPLDTTSRWWSYMTAGLKLRNKLTHAREATQISVQDVTHSLQGIVEAIDVLYRGIYRRPYPGKRRGLNSTMTF